MRFGFEMSSGGVQLIAAKRALSTPCLSAREIEASLEAIKADLDETVERMKKALREQQKQHAAFFDARYIHPRVERNS